MFEVKSFRNTHGNMFHIWLVNWNDVKIIIKIASTSLIPLMIKSISFKATVNELAMNTTFLCTDAHGQKEGLQK